MLSIRIIAPLALITMLVGCTQGMWNANAPRGMTKYEICSQLKRKIIFYQNDPNHNFQWRSPADMAALLRDYERFHCEDVLADKEVGHFHDRPFSVPVDPGKRAG